MSRRWRLERLKYRIRFFYYFVSIHSVCELKAFPVALMQTVFLISDGWVDRIDPANFTLVRGNVVLGRMCQ